MCSNMFQTSWWARLWRFRFSCWETKPLCLLCFSIISTTITVLSWPDINTSPHLNSLLPKAKSWTVLWHHWVLVSLQIFSRGGAENRLILKWPDSDLKGHIYRNYRATKRAPGPSAGGNCMDWKNVTHIHACDPSSTTSHTHTRAQSCWH